MRSSTGTGYPQLPGRDWPADEGMTPRLTVASSRPLAVASVFVVGTLAWVVLAAIFPRAGTSRRRCWRERASAMPESRPRRNDPDAPPCSSEMHAVRYESRHELEPGVEGLRPQVWVLWG